MYESFFNIRDNPFRITPDPAFLFLSHRHQEAMAHLLYSIRSSTGFVLLTGEVGTGKTTLSHGLLSQLPDNVDLALILNPRLTAVELVSSICDELHVAYPAGEQSLKVLIDRLNAHLLAAHAKGRNTVVIIDEAQNLDDALLEQIRLLTNLETASRKLLQIILIGQPELNDILSRHELRQLVQRITARYHIGPLTASETQSYIQHRLSVVGYQGMLFTPEAVKRVHKVTGGIPRLVNKVCDRAMLGAYAQGVRTIGPKVVRQAAREVLPPPQPLRLPRLPRPPRWGLAAVGGSVLALALWWQWPQLSHTLQQLAASRPQPAPADSAPPLPTRPAPQEENAPPRKAPVADSPGVKNPAPGDDPALAAAPHVASATPPEHAPQGTENGIGLNQAHTASLAPHQEHGAETALPEPEVTTSAETAPHGSAIPATPEAVAESDAEWDAVGMAARAGDTSAPQSAVPSGAAPATAVANPGATAAMAAHAPPATSASAAPLPEHPAGAGEADPQPAPAARNEAPAVPGPIPAAPTAEQATPAPVTEQIPPVTVTGKTPAGDVETSPPPAPPATAGEPSPAAEVAPLTVALAAGEAQHPVSGEQTEERGATAGSMASPSPAQAAPPTPPALLPRSDLAALLPRIPRNQGKALATLLTLWQPAGKAPSATSCAAIAQHTPLACLRSGGGWRRLHGLNLPAVLHLAAEGGQVSHFAPLQRLTHEGAILLLDGRPHRVSLLDLQDYWPGNFITLWRPPKGYHRVLREGLEGDDVVLLRAMLDRVLGPAPAPRPLTPLAVEPAAQLPQALLPPLPKAGDTPWEESSPAGDGIPLESLAQAVLGTRQPLAPWDPARFDDDLRQRVITFQRQVGLTPDGVAGPLTFLMLQRDGGTTGHAPILTADGPFPGG